MSIHQTVKKAILRYILGNSGEFPSQYRPPANISVEANKHWPIFWKKYGEFIIDSGKGDLDKTWAAAAAIFRNSCLKRNITPFKETEKITDTNSRSYLQKRFISNRKKLIKNGVSIIRAILKSKMATSANKEKFHKVHYNKTKEQISFISVISLDLMHSYSKLEQHITEFLKERGFEHDKHFILTDGITDLVIYADSKIKNRLNVYYVMHFTPAHVKYILNVADSAINTMDKLLGEAEKEFKLLLRKVESTVITADINYSSKPDWDIDFETPLTKQEQQNLLDIIKTVDETTADSLTSQFYIEYIIASSTTPQFKYCLVKALVNAFKLNNLVCPLPWEQAAKNPDDWFNPTFYIKRIQHEELEENEE